MFFNKTPRNKSFPLQIILALCCIVCFSFFIAYTPVLGAVDVLNPFEFDIAGSRYRIGEVADYSIDQLFEDGKIGYSSSDVYSSILPPYLVMVDENNNLIEDHDLINKGYFIFEIYKEFDPDITNQSFLYDIDKLLERRDALASYRNTYVAQEINDLIISTSAAALGGTVTGGIGALKAATEAAVDATVATCTDVRNWMLAIFYATGYAETIQAYEDLYNLLLNYDNTSAVWNHADASELLSYIYVLYVFDHIGFWDSTSSSVTMDATDFVIHHTNFNDAEAFLTNIGTNYLKGSLSSCLTVAIKNADALAITEYKTKIKQLKAFSTILLNISNLEGLTNALGDENDNSIMDLSELEASAQWLHEHGIVKHVDDNIWWNSRFNFFLVDEINNSSPYFGSAQYLPSSPSNTDSISFSVIYFDNNGDPVDSASVKVVVDGIEISMSGPSNASGTTFTSAGQIFSKGNHNYYFVGTQGGVAFRHPAGSETLSFTVTENTPDGLSLSANPPSVSVCGQESAIVTATLTSDGDPVEGQTVAFVILDGSGYLSDSSNVTDAQGKASTTFSPDTTGTATIGAIVPGMPVAEADVVVSNCATNITVSLYQKNCTDNSSTYKIQAKVIEPSSGDPIQNEEVTVSVTTLSHAYFGSLADGDGNSGNPLSTSTDNLGTIDAFLDVTQDDDILVSVSCMGTTKVIQNYVYAGCVEPADIQAFTVLPMQAADEHPDIITVSPDGSKLAVPYNYSGTYQVWIYDIDAVVKSSDRLLVKKSAW